MKGGTDYFPNFLIMKTVWSAVETFARSSENKFNFAQTTQWILIIQLIHQMALY